MEPPPPAELQEFIGQLDDELDEMQAAIMYLHHQNLELTRERDELKAQAANSSILLDNKAASMSGGSSVTDAANFGSTAPVTEPSSSTQTPTQLAPS